MNKCGRNVALSVRGLRSWSPLARAMPPAALILLACSLAAVAQEPEIKTATLSSVRLDENLLRVHFIDIGPGLAMLIQTPQNRKTAFVDGGKWGLDDLETYVKTFVPVNGTIDAAIVTHADSDHYMGMIRIFDSYNVRQFWNTGYESPKLSTISGWTTLLAKVDDEDGCEIYMPLEDFVSAGDTETFGGRGTASTSDDIKVRYLNVDASPPAIDAISGRSFDEGQRRNNASLVFKLLFGQVSFLITGDINGRDKEHEGSEHHNEIDSEELELWVRHTLNPARYGLGATVLQLPHHGSNGSSSVRFLQAVQPQWVVIPAGRQHDHPKEVLLPKSC